ARAEVGQRIDPSLPATPDELRRPELHEVLENRRRKPVIPPRARDLVRPPRPREPPLEVPNRLLRHPDNKPLHIHPAPKPPLTRKGCGDGVESVTRGRC